MSSASRALRSAGCAGALALASLTACIGAPAAPPGRERQPVSVPRLTMEVSARAAAGSRVSVAVGQPAGPPGARLVALQGRLRFDATRLRYIGQARDAGTYILVAPDGPDRGELRLAGFATGGMPDRAATFVFEVLAPGYADGLAFTAEIERRADGTLVKLARTTRATESAEAVVPADARPLSLADWKVIAAGGHPLRQEGVSRRPGEGLTYGDSDLNGVVDINDALGAALISVSLEPLLTNVAADYAIAANVDPANSPGLGEPDDPDPPGREADGTYVVNIVDALEIALHSVGLGGPVVARPVPGRVAPTATTTLSGVFTSDRQLAADTIYQLSGRVIVPRGVTLTIAPGTRLRALPPAAGGETAQLVVRQGGAIRASGTRLQPIVMTCAGAAAPGCWRGVVINGAALLNNDGITSNVVSCPTRQAPDGAGIYGGCRVEDASGTLRYVRIEYAGDATASGLPGAGLALNGVGSGTVIDTLQVYASAGDGVFVSGGRARLRSVMITDSRGRGLGWSDGWQGLGQGLVVQHGGLSAGAAIGGSNFSPQPDAGPRSAPTLYGLTLVGPRLGAAGPPAIVFGDGSAGLIANAVVIGFGTAFDVQGAASCARTADSLVVQQTFFDDNAANFATDADCADEVALSTAPARANRLSPPGLLAPYLTASPDLRPTVGGAADPAPAPPASGFFDPLLTFFGAVPPANGSRSNVPWYAGWTRGY